MLRKIQYSASFCPVYGWLLTHPLMCFIHSILMIKAFYKLFNQNSNGKAFILLMLIRLLRHNELLTLSFCKHS